jgi:predicted small lipoprotein YifL
MRTLLFASLIAFSLAACGNKGPLVLPDQTPQKPAASDKDKDKPKSAAAPAPASGSDAANKNGS